jgi:uncharacterized protein (TIGR03083 family)
MELKPRYAGTSILSMYDIDGTPSEASSRQAQRLVALVREFSDEQWAAPSRCEQWRVRDVISHLSTTNGFWAYSLGEGLRGEPSSLLANFDPVRTPPLLVASLSELSNQQVFEQYAASVDQLCALFETVRDDQWDMVAEAPPGHVSLREIGAHSLWDSWTHERDIAIPLNLPLSHEADEISWCLRYVAGLGAAFLATEGSTREGLLTIAVTQPELLITVQVGADVVVRETRDSDPPAMITGDATAVVESLSCRAPMISIGADHQWMLEGLTHVFETSA